MQTLKDDLGLVVISAPDNGLTIDNPGDTTQLKTTGGIAVDGDLEPISRFLEFITSGQPNVPLQGAARHAAVVCDAGRYADAAGRDQFR